MFNKPIKKTVFTLEVDGYAPEIVALTRPYLKRYADRIGADLFVITERKWPELPPVYEKLQIYELAQEMQNDWNIYFDSDALIHPETFDFTTQLSKDTITHNDKDFAAVRWDYDRYFLRDGRNIGSGNWFTIASDWCIELWKPLDDLEYEEAVRRIHPTNNERLAGIEPSHLIDDYVLSRNIAKYGLKVKTIKDILKQRGMEDAEFFHHNYLLSTKSKAAELERVIKNWKI